VGRKEKKREEKKKKSFENVGEWVLFQGRGMFSPHFEWSPVVQTPPRNTTHTFHGGQVFLARFIRLYRSPESVKIFLNILSPWETDPPPPLPSFCEHCVLHWYDMVIGQLGKVGGRLGGGGNA